jgi:hypothetical protein
MALTGEQMREAARRIGAWRANPSGPVACPVCGKPGLVIVDHSARPYAEWYALACAACGLSERLHIPLAPPVQPGTE